MGRCVQVAGCGGRARFFLPDLLRGTPVPLSLALYLSLSPAWCVVRGVQSSKWNAFRQYCRGSTDVSQVLIKGALEIGAYPIGQADHTSVGGVVRLGGVTAPSCNPWLCARLQGRGAGSPVWGALLCSCDTSACNTAIAAAAAVGVGVGAPVWEGGKQTEVTASSNMAFQLLLAGHSVFVNLLTRKEWEEMGATHESDLLYKAQEMRTNLKKIMAVSGAGLLLLLQSPPLGPRAHPPPWHSWHHVLLPAVLAFIPCPASLRLPRCCTDGRP